MKRWKISLIVLSNFIFFYFGVRNAFIYYGVESPFLYALIEFLSFILIPVFMYKAMEFIPVIKHISLVFFTITFSFLLMSVSSFNPPGIINMFIGISVYILVLSTFYLFVIGLTLEPTYYFDLRIGISLSLMSVLLILRYSSIIWIIYAVIADYGSSSDVHWNLALIHRIFSEGIYVGYFLLGFLTLYYILVERDKYYN